MATQPKSRSPEAAASPGSASPVEPWPLAFFACPNPDCPSFNIFGGDNLSVAEYMGKNKAIRRLYGNVCHGRFSERQGSLLQGSKLPPAEVVRIVKCFGYGLPVAATAEICGVDPRTVQRLLEKGGQRAEDFHQLHLERFNGTVRSRQSRLTRRTQQISRRGDLLQAGLWIFRDIYNWIKVHGSLHGCRPAMALGLTDPIWSLREYVCYPGHVSDLQRDIWAEQRQELQESAVDRHFRKKTVPTS